MNAQALFDLNPLGALVAFSDGTPRPPERFKNKLRDWKDRNGTGFFITRSVAREWDRNNSFTLQTENGRVLVVNKVVTVTADSNIAYTVTPPAAGTILAYSDYGGRVEVRHVWHNLAAAQDWATGGNNRYKFATCGHKYFLVAEDGSLVAGYMPEDAA